jgi:dTDP-glucose 4,6-dehydratase
MIPSKTNQGNPLAEDLEHVMDHTEPLWEELRQGRLFLTGATGFFGCWLLESFLWAKARLGLHTEVVVLTRNPEAFRARAPYLAEGAGVRLQAGDARNFPFPEGAFTHVIHAASDLNVPPPSVPAEWVAQACQATVRVLELAQARGTGKLLFTSSGAVYGPPQSQSGFRSEDEHAAPLPAEPRWAYSAAKRQCEQLCTRASAEGKLEAKIARGFSFIGPYLPLDAHLAAGNFIRDAIRGGPVVVQGSGSVLRSYLYGADLAVWLWTILFRGLAGRAYNVGSDNPTSVTALATAVANACQPPVAVEVLGRERPGAAPDVYVPDIRRARTELGLEAWIPLPEALRRTRLWHQRSR